MKKGIKQISEGEIYEMRILLKEGYSIPKVAERIGRNKTTIYRLLRVESFIKVHFNKNKNVI